MEPNLPISAYLPEEMTAVLKLDKAYQCRQIFAWIHKGIFQWQEMTNLPKALRTELENGHPILSSVVDQVIEDNDEKLYRSIEENRSLAFEPGALVKKEKLLIAVALDAAHGASNGVRSLATQALAAGATKEELMETLRVTAFISGAGSVYTAAAGLRDILS